MAESAADRLREERTRLGLNQPAFGKLGGVSKNTQLAYENGSSPITLDYLDKIAPHGVDVGYIVTGVRSGGAGVADKRLSFGGALPQAPVREDVVELAEIDLRYGMGATYVDGPVDSERRVFSRAWLQLFTRAPAESLFWTIGEGDSMEPTIRSGEVILIDRSHNTPRMGDGIWAVAMGEIGMIKRIHFPGEGRIELRSDNQVIPPINVAEDELHVVGRVVAVVRRL